MDNMEDDKMNDDEKLYLQFLQNNISRMNSNSAQVKGWCIAIVTALLAIYSETENYFFILFCLIPIMLFCIVDTLYLQQEHKFIGMYNDYVLNKNEKPKIYEMPMKKYSFGILGFLKALKSWSVALVYFPLLVVILIMLFVNTPKENFNTETVEEKKEKIIITSSQNENQLREVIITNVKNESNDNEDEEVENE